MIELRNIAFHYPSSSFSLRIDSLLVKDGRSLGIIGPSGCGKTTLLNLISGILSPREGEVLVNGEAINRLTASEKRKWRAASVGFVFQEFSLFEYLSVEENILLPVDLCDKDIPSVRRRLKEMSEKAGIVDLLQKLPENISHGEKQRVALLRALIHLPQLILADEPTGNLDPDNKKSAMDLLLKFTRENHIPLITVTHDHDLLPLFDEVLDFKTLVP